MNFVISHEQTSQSGTNPVILRPSLSGRGRCRRWPGSGASAGAAAAAHLPAAQGTRLPVPGDTLPGVPGRARPRGSGTLLHVPQITRGGGRPSGPTGWETATGVCTYRGWDPGGTRGRGGERGQRADIAGERWGSRRPRCDVAAGRLGFFFLHLFFTPKRIGFKPPCFPLLQITGNGVQLPQTCLRLCSAR